MSVEFTDHSCVKGQDFRRDRETHPAVVGEAPSCSLSGPLTHTPVAQGATAATDLREVSPDGPPSARSAHEQHG